MSRSFNTFKCTLVILLFSHIVSTAQTNIGMRRPTSKQTPMWLVHIDTWINADPKKCIDLIPEDIRPYVVFNISLSVSPFVMDKYPRTIAESWLRICAENRVWAMIQPASGYPNNFPYTDLEDYEYFYKKYPNFLGWNFCEQNWGFESQDKWLERINLFNGLVKMSKNYGGYLVVSSSQTMNTPANNGIGMLKLDPNFAAIAKAYKENFIFLEKYTTSRGFYDVESVSLGVYLSGYAGNYGIRFDDCGWTYLPRGGKHFPETTGAMPILEHALLTGQTVIDGPELTWLQTIYQANNSISPDGYSSKAFDVFPQFKNVSIDLFRKILDKTIRIPGKEEVISRTKITMVNDLTSGTDREKYSSKKELFTGLYGMDGEWDTNNVWLKKSGRYPTVPTIFKLGADENRGFEKVVPHSTYSSRWPTTQDKVDEFNAMFPEEYTGDMYVGRFYNSWITYNPHFDTAKVATNYRTTASIPFKYNTCEKMELDYSTYSVGVINEFSDKIDIYLNNYQTGATQARTDIIKIHGSTNRPTYMLTERANHSSSSIRDNWSNGILTLIITYDGPIDLRINCAGNAKGRLTNLPVTTIISPALPSVFTGDRQYEAENFEFKNIKNGDSKVAGNYSAMGYLEFGKNANASIKININALRGGVYQLKTKYSAIGGNVNSADLHVNGNKIATMLFKQTANADTWAVNTQIVTLKAGSNNIMFSANQVGTYDINFDYIMISALSNTKKYDFNNDMASSNAMNPPADLVTLHTGTAGVISYTGADKISNVFRAYSGGAVNQTGLADLVLFPTANNYSLTWKEYIGTPGAKKGVLLRAAGVNALCSYAPEMQQGYFFETVNNRGHTVTLAPYIAGPTGISPQTLYTSSFTIAPGEPVWYRASALGNRLKFECSKDSIYWEGGAVATFIDNTYIKGGSQLLWGFGADNLTWTIDDITFSAPSISISKAELTGFEYIEGTGSSAVNSIVVNGESLQGNVAINAPDHFEVSLTETSGFTNSLTLTRTADSIPSTTIYIRLKSGLMEASYNGNLAIITSGETHAVLLSGIVKVMKIYDFESDIATTTATSLIASNINLGIGNTATAGVVSYTDANRQTSNYLKGYSGGQRNTTAALDLILFPNSARDYAVTWKQVFLSSGKDYKNGVLLRGAEPAGTASTGYVQGLKQGYVFVAYNVGQTRTIFRIYRSTSTTSLNMVSDVAVNSLQVTPGQSVWYRASVSGNSPVNLKFEYSTDGVNWNAGASYTDVAASFITGTTQFVWGLAANTYDFHIDNITYEPVSSSALISVSTTTLTDFNYKYQSGPSVYQSFAVAGTSLAHHVVVTAPANFEVSLNSASGYSETVTLVQSGGAVSSTTVYTRLKEGLAANYYEGNITFSYQGIGSDLGKVVSLKGAVLEPKLMLTTSATLLDLGYVVGHESVQKSFMLSASRLADDVLVNVPADFEISLSPSTGFQSLLNLPKGNGSIEPTPIYIRLKTGLAVNTFQGDLSITSTKAEGKSLEIKGLVRSTGVITVSEAALTDLGYNHYAGNKAPVKSFMVWGNPLDSDISINAPANYEISVNAESGFSTSIVLIVNTGVVEPTIVYIRLKYSLSEGTYIGVISLTSGTARQYIQVNGMVSWSRVYDFTNDVSNTLAPILYTSMGAGNSATSGVVNYTNKHNQTSKALRAYSGGNRNATGIMDFNLFPTNATDYSVTWKQNIGSNTDYKVGMLLRGTDPVGLVTTGYVQGIKQGYVFIAYRNSGVAKTEFRIYPSTSAQTLTWLLNNSVSTLFPAAGETVWYKASVSGSMPVNLKFEYSTDGINWKIGAVTTHSGSAVYTSGSTQLVWGLGSPNFDFYLDDITFHSDVLLPVNLVSFNVKRDGQHVALHWNVLSETNNQGFVMERSMDGKTFETIGFVEGAGTSNIAKAYHFVDRSPNFGNNYYRLKQMDYDGAFIYSAVKVVSFDGVTSITLFPNPVQDILNVRSVKEEGTFVIIDAMGKVLLKATVQRGMVSQIDVSALPAGVYFYQLNSERGSYIKK